jgi:hypothetical protein
LLKYKYIFLYIYIYTYVYEIYVYILYVIYIYIYFCFFYFLDGSSSRGGGKLPPPLGEEDKGIEPLWGREDLGEGIWEAWGPEKGLARLPPSSQFPSQGWGLYPQLSPSTCYTDFSYKSKVPQGQLFLGPARIGSLLITMIRNF